MLSGPEPTGPERTGPEPTGPEPTGPEPAGPEPNGHELTGPEPAGPEPTDDAPAPILRRVGPRRLFRRLCCAWRVVRRCRRGAREKETRRDTERDLGFRRAEAVDRGAGVGGCMGIQRENKWTTRWNRYNRRPTLLGGPRRDEVEK